MYTDLDPNKPIILIVEDEEDMEWLINRSIEYGKDPIFKDVSIIICKSVEDAYSVINSLRDNIELIVLDLLVKDCSGFEVVEYLKSEGLDIDIVIVSAYATYENLMRGLHEHVYDFVPKPVDLATIGHIFRELLERRGKRSIKYKTIAETALSFMKNIKKDA
ncbi:MAG: response regulator [bacterium]|nr:response regulator [bacterium]